MEYENQQRNLLVAQAKYPEYANANERLRTFNNWPEDHHIMPRNLASSGFYYTGMADNVRCFHCGGGLRSWEQSDHWWVEHARWFPRCDFLRQSMGQTFVDTVIDLAKDRPQVYINEVINMMELQEQNERGCRYNSASL